MLVKPHHLLCLTSFLGFYNSQFINSSFLRHYSSVLFITSELFWMTGERKTFYHHLDLIVAKTYVAYALYLMKINNSLIIPNLAVTIGC